MASSLKSAFMVRPDLRLDEDLRLALLGDPPERVRALCGGGDFGHHARR
jgi:hypothetical protein